MTGVVFVSGLSGAGKASILRVLEDLGYEAVDNPPLTLVTTLVSRRERLLAVGLDARSRGFEADAVVGVLDGIKATLDVPVFLVFARAEPTALLRRFTETRRRHPLAPEGRVMDGIDLEERITLPLRDAADLVVDTSDLPLAELRRVIEQRFRPGAAERAASMTVTLTSFAFPAGLPREADMVFDARFLRNPHNDPALRPRTGLDGDVAAYVEADPDFAQFFGHVLELLTLVLPRFVQEGKKYATIAVGCTGGRHRSVRIVERLAPLLDAAGQAMKDVRWSVTVLHRELRSAQRAVDAGPWPQANTGASAEITGAAPGTATGVAGLRKV